MAKRCTPPPPPTRGVRGLWMAPVIFFGIMFIIFRDLIDNFQSFVSKQQLFIFIFFETFKLGAIHHPQRFFFGKFKPNHCQGVLVYILTDEFALLYEA